MNHGYRDPGIDHIRTRRQHPCYGMGLGIIVLDDPYPGFPGDVRNASAYPFPIQYEIAEGVDNDTLVWKEDKSPCLEPILRAASADLDNDSMPFMSVWALADRDATPVHRLVTLEIDSGDADAWGYEPVWRGEELAGFVTSGAYGHTVGKSLALAYLKTPYLESSGDEFSVHIVDERRPAVVLPQAAYDPAGARMRS